MSQPEMYDPGQARIADDRTSGWSVASLILGIASFCLWLFAAIPAIVCGIIGLKKSGASGGGKGLAIAGIVTGALGTVVPVIPMILVAMLLPAIQSAREAARRMDSTYKMRQQSLAAMLYQEEHGGVLPQAADTSEGPPSSWRLQLAPYLEASNVYDRYDFQQAWDGPANRPLADTMPSVYRNPNMPIDGITNYLALVGEETAFPADQANGGARIASQTVLFVEADEDLAVPWTQPKDIDYDPADPLAGLGNFRPGVFIVTFSDASTRSISSDIDPEVFRAMVSRSSDDNDRINATFFD